MRRFYLEDISGPSITLEGDELHHARSVLRVKLDQEITVFDGQGKERLVRILSVKKHSLLLEPLGEPLLIDRRPEREICVAVSFPKSRGRSFLIEKIVELGARQIQPLLTQRGVAPPETDRLQREALAACKQSGINHLPQIHSPIELKNLSGSLPDTLVLLDPNGQKETPQDNPLTIVIGPEGGFDLEEIKALPSYRWKLGDQILRTETACLAALAKLTI